MARALKIWAPCRITVTFFDEKDGSESAVQVPLGTNLLEAAHNNEVDLEGKSAARRCR